MSAPLPEADPARDGARPTDPGPETGERLNRWEETPVTELRERLGIPCLEVYARLLSTNDRAGRMAREGAAPYTVVLAEEQSSGRGRRGRSWHARPQEGMLLSVVLPGPATGRPMPGLTLLVGLAVAEAIEAVTPHAEVRLEWPNDLLIGGRKVCGVLCEAVGGATVAGIGVNVGGAPHADLAPRAASLAEVGIPPARSELLASILGRLRLRVGFRPPADLRGVADELARRDALRDRPVVSETVGFGVGRGIGPDGALLVEAEDGTVSRVTAGSVRLRD